MGRRIPIIKVNKMKTLQKIACLGALVGALLSCEKTEQKEWEEKVPTHSVNYYRAGQESQTDFTYREGYDVKFADGTVGIRKFELPLHTQSGHVKMYGHEGSDDYEIFRRKSSSIQDEAEILQNAAKTGHAVKVYGTKNADGTIEIKKIE